MKTSILICATCFIVTGCSAQLRFPSLSSALSSLTGFGGSSGSSGGQSGQPSSPYNGVVRDYARNLMAAMSNIYPTLFKPPQSQQQQPPQPQQSQASPQSPFDQFNAGQNGGNAGLFSSQSAPSFSFGGSTFSISPSLPFGSFSSSPQSQPSPSGSQSPFSASFGSSINSPSSFGPLSSAPFLPQSMPSFAPASSYNAAFEAANGGPSVGSSSFNSLSSGPSMHSNNNPSLSSAQILSQSSASSPINSFASMPNFNGQHDASMPILGQSSQHQAQSAPLSHQSGLGSHQSMSFGASPQNQQTAQQFSSQQYRPEIMSIAASAPVPSPSYCKFFAI